MSQNKDRIRNSDQGHKFKCWHYVSDNAALGEFLEGMLLRIRRETVFISRPSFCTQSAV